MTPATAKAALRALPSTVMRKSGENTHWIKLQDAVKAMDDMTETHDTSAEAVVRYQPGYDGNMRAHPRGYWTSNSDYQALAAKLTEVEAALDQMTAIKDIDQEKRHEHFERAEAAEAKLSAARKAL